MGVLGMKHTGDKKTFSEFAHIMPMTAYAEGQFDQIFGKTVPVRKVYIAPTNSMQTHKLEVAE